MFPEDPGKAVAQAHTKGLKALVDLLRERTSKDTKHLHSKAQNRLIIALEKWRKSCSQGNPDSSPVTEQEKGLRDLELENLWETTASYGNTETRRVRNEREGIVGPLNRLINILGSNLRDYFLLMYPLDTPTKIGKLKNKTIWGYISDEFGPVPVAHGADLAELDLADMIRSHGRELCRKSFIFGVPPNDFDSYALLLIRRLATFIDHIYTDTQLGNKHFLRSRSVTKTRPSGKCADEILRELVDELNSLYATGSTQQVFPSRTRTADDKPPEEEFFQFQIRKLRKASKNESKEEARRLLTWARYLKKLTPKKNPKLRKQDARHLYNIIRNKVRWEGIRYHRLITDGLPQAYNAESIIIRGDRFLQAGEDYLLVGESRLGTAEGPGRIDLALFVRTVITNPKRPGHLVVMKPVAVFDIKTRTSFDWEVRTKKSKGKRQKTVPRFIVRKRGMTDEEWNDALAEVPEDADTQQLNLYADGLVREYRRLTGVELVSDIIKGIVLLDTQLDAGLNRNVVRSLLDRLIDDHSLKSGLKGCRRLLIRSKDTIAKRATLVLNSPTESQFTILESERNPQEIEDKYDPFSEAQYTTTRHVLYLSARSASNSGFTAAWLAQYWHGLFYLQNLSSEYDNAPVTWIDLSGELGNDELARKRLRISRHEEKIQDFFKKIKVVDMSHAIEQFVFHGGGIPDIVSMFSEGLVVVSGWQWIEDSLPPRLRPVLEELERYMVQEINKSGNTSVWFLQPRPDERSSEKYHSRCLIPFWDSSEHRLHVTNIVWNLPVKPYTSVQSTPMLDDLRVIIKQTKEIVEKELVEVPLLENWSARFWSKKSKRPSKKKGRTTTPGRDALSAEDIIGIEELRKELINDSIDLIPWLCNNYPDKCKKDDEITIKLDVQCIPLYGEPMKPKSVMSRVMYRAHVRGAKGMRAFVSSQNLIPKEKITHPRHYRLYRRKKRRTVNTQTYRAPDEKHLEFRNLRDETARNVEIRRLRQTLSFLVKHKDSFATETSCSDFLKQLDGLVPDKSDPFELDELNKISELFMVHDVTSEIWDSMLWFRENRLGVGLRLNEQAYLDALLESRPYVATLYGNYLILLLVALTRKYPDLRIDQVQSLWLVVKSWHLRQIGFYLRDVSGVSRPKFDVRAIWSNLNKRAAVLTQLPQPAQSAVKYGQLIVTVHGDDYDYWVFIENEYNQDRLRSGLWIGQNPLTLTPTMKWSESDNREIADHASNVELKETHDLLACKIEGVEYLWLYGEDEWNLQGELVTISRKSSALASIRGMQIKPIFSGETPETPLGVTKPSNMTKRVKNELLDITRLRQHIFNTQCELGLETGMYTVNFESNGEQVDWRVVNRTSDLLDILRRPLVEGLPLQSSRDPSVYMSWNPYEDIDYRELQLLRPYVERKTPYVHVRVPLPLTCNELLDQPPVVSTVTISHDESECPLVDGTASDHGMCWRIKSEDSELSGLAASVLTDVDISSLINAGAVFLEGQRCKLNISFEVDPKERCGIVFRESKRIARALDLKPLRSGVFLELDSEQLRYVLTGYIDGVQVGIYSSITGERVSSGSLIPPKGNWQIKEVIEDFIEETKEFLKTYFSERMKPAKGIIDYNEMLIDLKNKLRRIKKGLPPLR